MNSLITKKYLPYQKIAESTDQNHKNLWIQNALTFLVLKTVLEEKLFPTINRKLKIYSK